MRKGRSRGPFSSVLAEGSAKYALEPPCNLVPPLNDGQIIGLDAFPCPIEEYAERAHHEEQKENIDQARPTAIIDHWRRLVDIISIVVLHGVTYRS